MANSEHLAILKQGVEVWNRWRSENPTQFPDLADADLSWRNGYAEQTPLDYANLQGAKMTGVRLTGTDVEYADLTGADLSDSDLTGCDLTGASLVSAILGNITTGVAYDQHVSYGTGFYRYTKMIGCDLRRASLFQARLGGSLFGETLLVQVDLTKATGLTDIRHGGPSVIDVDSLLKLDPALQGPFLQGIGVPESLIRYLTSHFSKPIQFYSCFISYSFANQSFADRLHADLQNQGVRCWFAPHNIQGGKKLHEQIDQAIRIYDRLLLILSDHSMNSEWVKTEIANARQREIREKRQMLFPISLVPYEKVKEWRAFDADTGKDSAREIGEYFIPDFSNWRDHDSYQAAFQRLLRDLKAEGPD